MTARRVRIRGVTEGPLAGEWDVVAREAPDVLLNRLDGSGPVLRLPVEAVEDVPDPLPPEPPVGSLWLDKDGVWRRSARGWYVLGDTWNAGPHPWDARGEGQLIYEPGVTRVVLPDEYDEAMSDIAHRVEDAEDRVGPRRRRYLTRERLERVAEVYRRAEAEGRAPTQAVQIELDAGSYSSAARWVSMARKARPPLLEPSRKQRASTND